MFGKLVGDMAYFAPLHNLIIDGLLFTIKIDIGIDDPGNDVTWYQSTHLTLVKIANECVSENINLHLNYRLFNFFVSVNCIYII